MTDITDTLAPNSDQLDAVDLLSGPRTFTIDSTTVNAGAEQPVSIRLVEFPRVWRPGKSMRRVLAAAWGAESSQWVGHRLTLFCDPNVKFGGESVGGTRISHMSHLDKPLSVPLLVTRGKSATFKVAVLKDAPRPQQPTPDQIEACTDRDQLLAWWQTATDDLKPLIQARGEALKALPTTDAAQPDERGGEPQ